VAIALAQALGFVVVASTKNRLVRQVKRLRQPRYLVATAVGIAYWWFYLGKRWFSGFGGSASTTVRDARPLFIAGGTILLAAIALVGWFAGSDQSRVTFTEAEVQFLFPAPTTRRQLLHYKLMRSILVSFFSAVIYTLLFRRASGRPIFMTLGGWIAVTTLSMHWTAASFVRKSLAEHGLTGLKRTAARMLAFGSFVALVVVAILRTPHPDSVEPNLASLLAWGEVVTTPPLGWVLWPVRASVRLALAGSLAEFAGALPAALGVLLLHYLWVIRSAESFEDEAVAAAERRARWREARRSGRSTWNVPEQSRRPPFRLGVRGRPEVAFVWRNLIRMSRALRTRFFVVLLPFVFAVGLAVYFTSRTGAPGELRAIFASLLLSLYGVVVFIGPVIARSTLADPEHAEMLRSAPVSGFQIVGGETLGPLVVLAAIQWLFLVPGILFLPGDAGLTQLAQRIDVIVGFALVGPSLSLGGVLVQNAAAVLVPGWVTAGRERGGGPEVMGMRMLVLLGNLLALAVLAIPAAVTGGGLTFALWGILGWNAVPIGSLVAAITIAMEAGLAVGLLGKAFDRYDLSAV
jgi:ABC-2 type transport system permease protein